MPIAVLYPRYDHPAIEERYASWQTQMLLKGGEDVARIAFYGRDEEARDVVGDVDEEHVLVITDPLLLSSKNLGARLRSGLRASGALAVVPVSNEAPHPRQRIPPPAPYLTLRELQAAIDDRAQQAPSFERLTWDRSDPAAFVCRTAALDDVRVPLREALSSRDVAISRTDFIHRWSSLRGQTRFDLLERIGTSARSILEFGCGEAPLGEALKKRQKCRVVGIELDPEAAAVARKRIDAVYRGDVREIVEILDERFDWIVGGDIVEHLDEPWSFLAELRRLAAPGGHLLLSIPNLANASVVSDLLHGRFDYVYMGLTCVGHVRLFTKQTIADMLTIAGWTIVEIAPQNLGLTPQGAGLLGALDAAAVDYSKNDLEPTGYYVTARND
jgi:2-polyprenyl-3-methyl-5-hydroxy-6-metoxy-1,4-benzoquinol methylase